MTRKPEGLAALFIMETWRLLWLWIHFQSAAISAEKGSQETARHPKWRSLCSGGFSETLGCEKFHWHRESEFYLGCFIPFKLESPGHLNINRYTKVYIFSLFKKIGVEKRTLHIVTQPGRGRLEISTACLSAPPVLPDHLCRVLPASLYPCVQHRRWGPTEHFHPFFLLVRTHCVAL